MSEFDIKLAKVKKILDDQDSIIKELQKLKENIDSVSHNLGMNTSSVEIFKRNLKKVSGAVEQEQRATVNLKNGLDNITTRYEQAETNILNATEDGKISLLEKARQNAENVTDKLSTLQFKIAQIGGMSGKATTAIGEHSHELVGPFSFIINDDGEIEYVSTKTANFSKEPENPPKEKKDKFQRKGYKDKNGDEYFVKDGKYYKNGNEITDANETKKIKDNIDNYKEVDSFPENDLPFDADVKATLLSGSAEWAAISASGELSGKYGSMSGEVKVLDAEVHGSAYATPLGFGGEIGGSVTAFSAEGEAMVGNDNLGIYAKGSVAAGQLSANASADIGLLDKDGNFNPTLAAAAGASAIAVSATATGGAKILGVDASGSVTAEVGLDAHAKVGYKDGVLAFDVGVAVGVGVSTSVSIDVGGAIDKVGKLAAKGMNVAVGKASSVLKAFGW